MNEDWADKRAQELCRNLWEELNEDISDEFCVECQERWEELSPETSESDEEDSDGLDFLSWADTPDMIADALRDARAQAVAEGADAAMSSMRLGIIMGLVIGGLVIWQIAK